MGGWTREEEPIYGEWALEEYPIYGGSALAEYPIYGASSYHDYPLSAAPYPEGYALTGGMGHDSTYGQERTEHGCGVTQWGTVTNRKRGKR